MNVENRLLALKLPHVGAAYFDQSDPRSAEFLQPFSLAVNYARAAQGDANVLIETVGGVTILQDLKDLCEILLKALETPTEKLTMEVIQIGSGVCKLTIHAHCK